MSVNDDLRNESVRHQILISRYGNSAVRKVLTLVNEYDKELVQEIIANDPDLVKAAWSEKRVEKLILSIKESSAELYTKAMLVLKKELVEFAEYENAYNAEKLNSIIPVGVSIAVPGKKIFDSIVSDKSFQGRYLHEWFNALSEDKATKVSDALRIGFSEGRSTNEIVRTIRGKREYGFKDGILETTRRNAKAIIMTSINHVSSSVREELFRSNDDLVKGVQWVSTLDGRTSSTCRARDGEVFKVGEGPRPPAHINCRSTTVAVLKSYREMGIDKDELDAGTRASMDGQVAATETYQTWLKKQPRSFVEEVLGKRKAKLYLDGNLKLDRFVDNAGREYNLDELRKLESRAFEKAGIE